MWKNVFHYKKTKIHFSENILILVWQTHINHLVQGIIAAN